MVSEAVQNPLSPGCEVTPEWNVKVTRKAFHMFCPGSDASSGGSWHTQWHQEGDEVCIRGPPKRLPELLDWGPDYLLWLLTFKWYLWYRGWHYPQWPHCQANFLVWQQIWLWNLTTKLATATESPQTLRSLKSKKLWTMHPIKNRRGTEWLSATGDSLPLLSPKTLSIYPHIFQVRLT